MLQTRMNEPVKEYLIGKRIFGFTEEKKVILPTKEEEMKVRKLSSKERALRFNGFMVIDEGGNIVFEDRKRYSLHFFPLSVIDYVSALYNFERHNQQIPILSVDSHDVLGCDFRCQDCLSGHGANFPVNDFPKNNFNMGLEIYQGILKSIAEYSKRRGFIGVRFEQSGEGNPDFYKYRKQILEYAKELQMQSVYVSTGSKIDGDLLKVLIENSFFIRISFPGLGSSYKFYSGQTSYTYNDALDKLESIVQRRGRAERSKDLMIGARVALRKEHEETYFAFASTLKSIGVDSLQIVKILVPEGKKQSDFPLTYKDRNDLERIVTLNDTTFNVSIPHSLDYMVYSREIKNREDFPPQCFNAIFQPVLAGRSLFVCTISDVMYNPALRLGTFTGAEGELERFLSPQNIGSVTKEIPAQCKSCSNIYDNMLLFSLQQLFKANPKVLKFYEIIENEQI